jgi:hypothetical protein
VESVRARSASCTGVASVRKKGLSHPLTLDFSLILDFERADASREEVNTSSAAIYALINGEKGRDVPWNRLPLFVPR